MDDYGYTADKYAPEFPEREPTQADRYHAEIMMSGVDSTEHGQRDIVLCNSISWHDKYQLGFYAPAAEIVDDIIAEVTGEDCAKRAYDEDLENGMICDEGSFSRSGCGICGMPLGADLHVYHWIDSDGQVIHETDGCTDCLCYWASGDIPADEYLGWTGEEAEAEAVHVGYDCEADCEFSETISALNQAPR